MFPLPQTRPCLALPPGSAHPSPSSSGNFQTSQHSSLSTFRQGIHSSLATAPLTPFPATLTDRSQLTENSATLSPVSATLTDTVAHNPFVCHSYKKHRGYTFQPGISFRSLTTRHSPLATISFIIRTSKTQHLNSFRMNTSEKTGVEDRRTSRRPTELSSFDFRLPTFNWRVARPRFLGLGLSLFRAIGVRNQCGAALDVGAASTPKSHTYKFNPSCRISASAYSPGGSGALSVNLYMSGATSQRWIAISTRSCDNSCPKRLRMDSSILLFPLTFARTRATSGPSAPCRPLLSTVESWSGSGAGSRR